MSGKTVLVVDDEPHIRYVLELKLGRAGFTVITAGDGRRAYELACRHMPDLVVTDYQMPDTDGLGLCRLLMENPKTRAIPTLLLTGRGYKVPPSDLATTNIRCVMDKPFSPIELLAQIQELLNDAAAEETRHDDDTGASAA